MSWAKEVWSTHNTPKHMFILWLATLGKLSTYDRLLFLDVDPGCRLCGDELETHDHLFFECPLVRFGVRSVCASRFLLMCPQLGLLCVGCDGMPARALTGHVSLLSRLRSTSFGMPGMLVFFMVI